MAPPANWGLTANLIARVIFAFISILLNWVPLRLLIRNGEFPAIVLIIDLVIMNLITIANSIIWRNDDYTQWWDGAILCDAEVYLAVPLQTVYSAAIFTVMYNLAEQVKVAAIRPGLEPGRKTRRNLIQAAIIFPVPLIQIGFTYFDLAQRYLVGTLIGCFAFYDSSWPKTLVYDAPSAVFALLSVPYAILLWKRYDAIAKRTLSIFRSSDRVSLRINRTRRRLSRMSLAILVIYLPVVLYYAISNGKDTAAAYQPYSFRRIRESNIPYPWDSILFVPSWVLPSTLINQPWLTIATSFAVVLFFGTTAEAQEMYWLYARHLGIDNFLKSLKWKGGICGRNAAPTDSSSSPRNISPYPARDSMEYNRRRSSALTTIRRPEAAVMAQSPSFFSRSPSFSFSLSPSFLSPSAWRKRFRMGCPPVIPPRFSSLRHTFIFRTPTIQSLKQAFRIPSLASSGTIHTSGASNRTAGHRTDFTSDDSFNMLPLYQDSRRAAETLRSPSDAYCTQGRDTGMQSGRMSRLGNHRTQVRIPIVRQPVRQPVRQSFSAGTNDADYADEPDDSILSQDITLGSFFTNDSDIHMNPSWAYTVQGEVGIAR